MASTSNNLRITLIGTGEQAGTWGDTTNLNLGTLLEQAIGGYTTKTIASTSSYLVVEDGKSSEFRNANIRLETALSTDFRVFVPPYAKSYTILNATDQDAYIAVATNPNDTTPAQKFNATIADTVMTVISVQPNVLLSVGANIASVSGSSVAVNTRIVSQTNGTPGGAGEYVISTTNTVSTSTLMYAGLRIPPGATMSFFCTGTSLFESLNNIAGDLAVQGSLVIGGGSIFDGDGTFSGNGYFGGTGSLRPPVGTTAERAGQGIRYNTTLSRYEGYDINASTWSTIGGGATGGGANQVFYENDNNITASYSITANKNAMTTGPVTITSFNGTGSISGSTLTIAASPAPTGSLYIGAVIRGPGSEITVGTTITGFIGSASGGAGSYTISNGPQTVPAGTSIISDVVVTVPTTSNWVILG